MNVTIRVAFDELLRSSYRGSHVCAIVRRLEEWMPTSGRAHRRVSSRSFRQLGPRGWLRQQVELVGDIPPEFVDRAAEFNSTAPSEAMTRYMYQVICEVKTPSHLVVWAPLWQVSYV